MVRNVPEQVAVDMWCLNTVSVLGELDEITSAGYWYLLYFLLN